MMKTNFKTKFWAILLAFMTALSILTVPLTALAEGDIPQPAGGPLLSSLSVTSGDSNILEGFSSDEFNYSIEAPNNLRNVTIAAAPGTEGDTVDGVGEYPLNIGENTFKVTVSRAAEGSEPLNQDYIITINRAEAAEDYEYTVTDGNATITKYNGTGGDITIPDTLDEYPVTAIGDRAFYANESITGVTIPEGVMDIKFAAFDSCSNLVTISLPDSLISIGFNAFAGTAITTIDIPKNVTNIEETFNFCTNLEAINADPLSTEYSSVNGVLFSKDQTAVLRYPKAKSGTFYTIPSAVTVIGESAFCECTSLVNIDIPNGVTTIGDCAFSGCYLESIDIPDSVTTIKSSAFYACQSMTEINIPAGVEEIGEMAFDGGSSLTSINVDASNAYYVSVDGVLFNKDKTTLMQYPARKSGISYSIPDTVTAIEPYAFGFSSLRAVKIPDGVINIKRNAFFMCSELYSLEIPDSVTNIDDSFWYCYGLQEIVFLGERPSATETEFEGCDDLTIYYATGKTGYPEGKWNGRPIYAFDPAEEHSLIYDANGGSGSTPAAGSYAYGESVTLSDAGGLTGEFTGWNTKADGSGISFAPGDTYKMCPHDLTLYAVWQSGGGNTFGDFKYIDEGASITITGYTGNEAQVTIPDVIDSKPVTIIGDSAFYDNQSITGVTIPEGVTKIGYGAFDSCSNLITVSLPVSLTTIEGDAFFGAGLTSVDIPVNVTAIGIEEFGAFGNCFGLTAINVDPDNTAYSSAGSALFNKAQTTILQYPIGLEDTSYTIPSSVTAIGPYAFRNSSLENVVIPEGVTEIGDGAFWGCGRIENVTIPGCVTKIGHEAFVICSSLQEVYIPAGTQAIGPAAFAGCSSLSSIGVDPSNGYYASVDGVLFDKGITTLLAYPAGKSGISYTIPDTVTVIGESSFRESRLKAVIIPNSVTSIKFRAFEFCFDLLGIEIPASVAEMNWGFEACTNLTEAVFLGDRPANNEPYFTDYEFIDCNNVTIYYVSGKTGFPEGEWNGRPVYAFDPTVEHSLTYAANGGSGSVPADSNTYAYGESVAIPDAGGLTRRSYRFMGWNTMADGSGFNYAAGDTYKMCPHDVTLYANWTNTFTVTFDSQGGTPVTSKTVKYNALIKAPKPPTRTGYSFKGWYKEPECLSAWKFSKNRVTNNITLYARWTPKTYKVKFNSQGGSAVRYASVVYNTLVKKPSDPNRKGYDFAGWYKESACTNTWAFDTDYMPANNMTLYAKWNIHHHSVTFNANGGDFIDNGESLGSTLVREKIAYHSLLYAPLIPVRAHYTFKGWYKEPACTHPWYFSTSRTPDRDLTLYVKWQPGA